MLRKALNQGTDYSAKGGTDRSVPSWTPPARRRSREYRTNCPSFRPMRGLVSSWRSPRLPAWPARPGASASPPPKTRSRPWTSPCFPTAAGLPAGKGTPAKGKDIFKDKCAVCHNDQGQGREGQYPALVGGMGTLNTPKPVKTVGSYWPYATTVFDYVRRAMPYDQPGTLQADEIYSLVGFILNLNGIIGENDEMKRHAAQGEDAESRRVCAGRASGREGKTLAPICRACGPGRFRLRCRRTQ